MKKDRSYMAHNLRTLIIVFCFILVCAMSVQAATMPEYTRLQPVTERLTAPTAVALDRYENLYVTDSVENRLLIYSQSGRLLKTLNGLSEPLGVAVDSGGRIFVGNKVRGNVEIYDTNLDFISRLGTGDGEFKQPSAIAVSGSGDIYVVDSEADLVKVYNPDGTSKYSFGGSGSGNGQFNFPTSIAIDETSGEIVVADRQLRLSGTEMVNGARIQVFDLNGIYKRSFGEYGIGTGKLSRPVGVIKDEQGRIYVSDAYQQVIRIFDDSGLYLGSIFGTEHQLRTPLGLVKGKSNRLFIASLNTENVEVYGIDNYTQMEVAPLSLSFEGIANGDNPETQTVDITNTGNSDLNWSASSGESWIILPATTGTIAQSESQVLHIGVNLEGLAAESYEGSVAISAESGATEIVNIALTVVRPPTPELAVSPVSLEFTSLNGAQPSSQNISILNTGEGELNWTSASDSTWLTMSRDSGTAPDSVDVNVNLASLSAGTYTDTIMITGEGTTSGPQTVSVTLLVMEEKGTINVSTNLKTATFVINGPASYSGVGKQWSVDNAPAGLYIITFGDIPGYTQPVSQAYTLEKDGIISFSGDYVRSGDYTNFPVSYRQVITGSGIGSEDTGTVRVYNPDGSATGVEFLAHQYTHGVNVAAGDVNCDGFDEIITAPGPGPSNPAEIKIFDRNGQGLSELTTSAFDYKYGANVASCDFDRDGHSEVVVGSGKGNPAEVRIFAYDADQNKLVDSGLRLLAFDTNNGVHVATADIDCDETSELITSSGTGIGTKAIKGWIRIWKVDTSKGIGQWSASLIKEIPLESRYVNSSGLAAGDINGDYVDEIIMGTGPLYKKSFDVKIVDGDGTDVSAFNVGEGDSYGSNLASGDFDGDGISEIVTGTNSGMNNEAAVKIFDASGILRGSFTVHNSGYGLNVAVGNLGVGE